MGLEWKGNREARRCAAGSLRVNAAVLEGRAELEQRLATIGTMERRYGCLWSLLIEDVMSGVYVSPTPCNYILSPWRDK